jgi:hypothetical protein
MTAIFPFLSSPIIRSSVVCSSSKVITSKSLPLLSCFITPSIPFRIAPILALEFQAEQPGTFNWMTLSLAKAVEEKVTQNKIQNNMPVIFFIGHLCYVVVI